MGFSFNKSDRKISKLSDIKPYLKIVSYVIIIDVHEQVSFNAVSD